MKNKPLYILLPAMLLLLGSIAKAQPLRVAIKSDAAYWLISTPNIEMEIKPGKGFSSYSIGYYSGSRQYKQSFPEKNRSFVQFKVKLITIPEKGTVNNNELQLTYKTYLTRNISAPIGAYMLVKLGLGVADVGGYTPVNPEKKATRDDPAGIYPLKPYVLYDQKYGRAGVGLGWQSLLSKHFVLDFGASAQYVGFKITDENRRIIAPLVHNFGIPSPINVGSKTQPSRIGICAHLSLGFMF